MPFYDEHNHEIDMPVEDLAHRKTLLFDPPRLHQPVPVTVHSNARISGHLARWQNCSYASYAPPRNATGYRVLTRPYEISGHLYGLARIGLGGHADQHLSMDEAAAHYRAQPAAGWVTVGEDEHGVWLHGMTHRYFARRARSGMRMQAYVSGDWRRTPTGTTMELVGLLYVGDQAEGLVPYG